MKKIISLILALLILCAISITAFADQKLDCLTISDISIESTTDGNKLTLNLDGLEAVIAPIPPESENMFSINVFGNGELLLNASLSIDGNAAYIAIDGMSDVYSLDLDTLLPTTLTANTSLNWERLISTIEQMIADFDLNKDGFSSDLDMKQEFIGQTVHISFNPTDLHALFELEKDGELFSFSTTVQCSNRAVTYYEIDDLPGALDMNKLDDEQIDILKSELTNVLAKPVSFLLPSLMKSGLIG